MVSVQDRSLVIRIIFLLLIDFSAVAHLQEVQKREGQKAAAATGEVPSVKDVEVVTATSITTTYSVAYNKSTVSITKSGASSHVAEVDGRLMIYLSEDSKSRKLAWHRDVPEQIVSHLGLSGTTAYKLIMSLLHVPLDCLDKVLIEEGIISGEKAEYVDPFASPADSEEEWDLGSAELFKGQDQPDRNLTEPVQREQGQTASRASHTRTLTSPNSSGSTPSHSSQQPAGSAYTKTAFNRSVNMSWLRRQIIRMARGASSRGSFIMAADQRVTTGNTPDTSFAGGLTEQFRTTVPTPSTSSRTSMTVRSSSGNTPSASLGGQGQAHDSSTRLPASPTLGDQDSDIRIGFLGEQYVRLSFSYMTPRVLSLTTSRS